MPRKRKSWGLVNKVVPKGQAYEAALVIAQKIADKSSYTLRLAKKALTYGLEVSGMDAALFIEREGRPVWLRKVKAFKRG